jgi:anti-sigma factor RsiW
MTELSDELLLAYIDGQLDKPQAMVVSQIVQRDGELAARVHRLQDSQAKFLDLFGTLIRDGATSPAKPPGRAARSQQSPAEPSGMATAGVAALLLILGASLGFTIAYYTGISRGVVAEDVTVRPANWTEDIAELHAYFTPEALTTTRDSQSNSDVVRFQLAKLSSQAVPLPDLSQSGLRFVRAQTLSYRGNRLMQLVYTGKSDPLVAVYITAGDDDSPVSPGRFGDIKTVSWSQNGLRFLIAADMTHEALRALAAVTQSQLTKG